MQKPSGLYEGVPGVEAQHFQISPPQALPTYGTTARPAGGSAPAAQSRYQQLGWWGRSAYGYDQEPNKPVQYSFHDPSANYAQLCQLIVPGYHDVVYGLQIPTSAPGFAVAPELNPDATTFVPRETRSMRRARLLRECESPDVIQVQTTLTAPPPTLPLQTPSGQIPTPAAQEPIKGSRAHRPRKAKKQPQQSEPVSVDRLPPHLHLNDILANFNKSGAPLNATAEVANIPFRPASRSSPTPPPPPRPTPTSAYIKRRSERSIKLETPRPLLIVLDLNGTVLHRRGRGGSSFKKRPHVMEFLDYLFTHHNVMIWSSAKPQNVEGMCAKLLTAEQQNQLIARWGRDTLRLSAQQYDAKVQVYKQLSWIWQDKKIQSANPNFREVWSQENTVLIDDSDVKAASEPSNLIQIEEFEGRKDQMESDVLGQVVAYLESLRWAANVSAQIHQKPFQYDTNRSFDWTVLEKACEVLRV